MSENPTLFYEFGPFRLEEKERRLLRDGEEVTLSESGRTERLTPKAFDLLLLLIKQSGQMVGRDELMERIWPGTFVEDNRLSDNISTLRKFLGDRPRDPQFIETIPKHGYRFLADVREVRGETIAILDHTKTYVVIKDERETPSADAPDANGYAMQHTFTPVLPPGGKSRRRLNPLAIAAGCVLLGALAVAIYSALKRKSEQPAGQALMARSIAVLPFKPLVSSSSDPALELGMTDALINKLTNIRQITVRPTSSVLKYTSDGQDLRAAGSELGVDVLLDGKVQKADDRIRLSVQLLRASDGTPFWADKFDEKFTDIFAVQDAISDRIASTLALQLTGEEKRGLAKRYTESVEAYQLYLKGHHHWRTFRRAEVQTSINYFNEALKKDPNYALAYSGLAFAFSVIGINGPLPAREAMSRSREAAQRALELDDNLAEAHIALGAVKVFYEWDWPGAEREFKRALELNPNYADAHNLYGYYLQAMGKGDAAVLEMKRAKELAPEWRVPNNDYLLALFSARRYDEAIEQSRQVTKLDQSNYFAYTILGQSLAQQGRYEEAAAEHERAVSLPAQQPTSRALTELGYFYAVTGKKGEALKIIERLKEKAEPKMPFDVAEVYAGLGDKDQAFAWLDRSVKERFAFTWKVVIMPQFDGLRSDPRYGALLRRMNLAP
jgi:TolB-like protein/DNA-binding winged helix-turn-helix (wHTH) protein/Flp pilus assembly protein TadD